MGRERTRSPRATDSKAWSVRTSFQLRSVGAFASALPDEPVSSQILNPLKSLRTQSNSQDSDLTSSSILFRLKSLIALSLIYFSLNTVLFFFFPGSSSCGC